MKQYWQWVFRLLLLAALPAIGQAADTGSQADGNRAEEASSVPEAPENSTEAAERVQGQIGASREKLEATRRRNLELAERRARLERRLAELRQELKKRDQLRDQLIDSLAASKEAATVESPGEEQVEERPGTAVPPQ